MSESSDDGTPVPHNKLVELAQAGDPEAFTALFNCYSPGICGYVVGMVKHPEDTDELAQEIFFKAWKELPRLQQTTSFKPWLYRIATNVVHDYWRYQQSRRLFWWSSLENCEDLDDSKSFEEHVVEGELVRQALKQVPRKYRTCLLLEIEGKLSRSEIAEVVKISPPSVGIYISKARERFRQAYQGLEQHTNEERRSM
jgi:RNA polymerase sigma-70 factor (ECF subfamily)